MYSNGTLITEDLVKKLSDYKISFLQISLAGSKEAHDKKRVFKNGEGSYEKTINAIKLSLKSKIPLVVAVNVDKDNKDTMGELLNDLINRGLKGVRIMFTPIYSMPHSCADYEPHCLSFDEWGDLLPTLQKIDPNFTFSEPVFDSSALFYPSSAQSKR